MLKILLALPMAFGASAALADLLTCVDENVGKSGWSQTASLTRNGATYSGLVRGKGPGEPFEYAVSGRNGFSGQRSEGQTLNVRKLGDGFSGVYRDGRGKNWSVRMVCIESD